MNTTGYIEIELNNINTKLNQLNTSNILFKNDIKYLTDINLLSDRRISLLESHLELSNKKIDLLLQKFDKLETREFNPRLLSPPKIKPRVYDSFEFKPSKIDYGQDLSKKYNYDKKYNYTYDKKLSKNSETKDTEIKDSEKKDFEKKEDEYYKKLLNKQFSVPNKRKDPTPEYKRPKITTKKNPLTTNQSPPVNNVKKPPIIPKMSTIIIDSMMAPGSGSDENKFFDNFFDLLNKKNPVKKEEDIASTISDYTEYDSEDEFEELDLNINSIDDLIELADLYKKLTEKKNIKEEKKVSYDSVVSCDSCDSSDSSICSNLDSRNFKEDDKEYTVKDTEILKKNGIDVKFFEQNFKKQPYVKIVNNDKKESNNNKDEKPDQKKKGYYLNGKRYSIDLEKVYNLKEPLIILKNMIGMDKVKKTVLDLILYYIQRFEKQNSDMLHTIIEGPPGVGKTELGKILGKVYKALGILKSDKFTIATRSDLIGQYLGQTAPKTQEVIDNAAGGVLFIDEAYSLGNSEKRDSFAKECIDTINLNLDKNKKKIIVIIAGYKEELESSFFSYNPGLKRRFPFVFTIDGYNPKELKDIFIKKVVDSNWSINKESLDEKKLVNFFTTNKKLFPYYGGDMETLFQACKLIHSKRILGKHPKNKRKFSKEDIYDGLERFKEMRKKKEDNYFLNSLYM